jgi:penicillin-binding protein 1A
VLIVDPNTGKILSMVGGRGFSYSFLNGVTQMKKSPGSICKILPCITAFEQNFPVDYPLEDRPIYVDANNNINYINEDEISDYMEIKNIKVIRNHDKKYIGPTTIKTAFEKSRNVPMIILTKLVGINNVKNTAVNMGIISEDTPFYLSGSLGSIYVNIYSMVKGLSMLANGGNKIPNLYYIHKITDLKGNLVYENPEINPINNSEEKVLKNKTINNINNLCEGVIRNGIRNKLDCISKKIAGKTGTSQENKEAAFVVWSKNYLIYVMVYNMDHENPAYKLWGNDIPLEISKNILIYLEESLEETIKLQE